MPQAGWHLPPVNGNSPTVAPLHCPWLSLTVLESVLPPSSSASVTEGRPAPPLVLPLAQCFSYLIPPTALWCLKWSLLHPPMPKK